MTKSKNPVGRPAYTIDWHKVEQLLMAGCTGTEVASHFGMHADTFCRHVEKEKGKLFTDYAAEFRQKGDTLLRAAQFQKALEKDNTMMIWLGKQRLKQKEDPNKSTDEMNLSQLLKRMMEGGATQQ